MVSQADDDSSANEAKPVGQGDHVVKEGECMSSIAEANGHFWETVWNDSDNSELKQEREDPNVLLPGDRVTIPDLRRKEESKAANKRHRFRRKGVPAKLEIQVLEFGEPRANETFFLEVDGKTVVENGTTDGDGKISEPLPCGALKGRLVVGEPADQIVYELNFGTLLPASTDQGAQQRLQSLGYDCGDDDGEPGNRTAEAVAQFQADNDLDPTGDLDDETLEKLKELHGA